MAHQDWIQNLLKPGAFLHDTGKMQLLQTHISWIVLTGRYAYKVKKPVRFSFVDFSTLELRRRSCLDELTLNRRWNDDRYIEVCQVTGTHEKPCVSGDGNVIDYAVRMKQFDQRELLVHLLDDDHLQPRHFEIFALRLAHFHQQADGKPGPRLGTPEVIRQHVMDNLDILFRDGLPEPDRLLANRVREFSDRWFEGHRDMLAARRATGFVRECHGDLHLRNMLLCNDRIELFDCLEFNAALRWSDVMSEVAFLTMDLENHGRRDLARRFLNAYVEHTGDHAGLAVLPFYMAYRAVVRAKVDQLRRIQAKKRPRKRLELLHELESYLMEAAAYTRTVKPRLAVMCGLSASGKTRHSQDFVNHGFIRLRSDFERKRLAGSTRDVPVQGRAGPVVNPPATELYSPAFTERTYRALGERAEMCLAAGYSVVIDAACLQKRQRRIWLRLADHLGVSVRIFLLDAPVELLEARISERGDDDLSDADIDVLHGQLATMEPLSGDELNHASVIDLRQEQPGQVISAWLEEKPRT